jgi:hypothetical protein
VEVAATPAQADAPPVAETNGRVAVPPRDAAEAEQRARVAQREAEAQRAQAELHAEKAGLHERGLADDDLRDADDPDEVVRRRDTFADREPADRDVRGDSRADDPVHDREAKR